jgi:hypothetical protein
LSKAGVYRGSENFDSIGQLKTIMYQLQIDLMNAT